MTIDDKTRDKKEQYHIKRKAEKISTFQSGKIDKYGYLAVEKTLPFDQRRVLEQAKFTYPLQEKALDKQRKTIEYQRENK